MTKERRGELRALLGKASPLPWHWGESRSECLCEDGIIDADGGAVIVNCGRGSGEPTEDDVRLIIAAVNELRALLDSDERLEAAGDAGYAVYIKGMGPSSYEQGLRDAAGTILNKIQPTGFPSAKAKAEADNVVITGPAEPAEDEPSQ